MAVTSADIQHRLSIATATEGDADPQPDPAASLGKHASTTLLVDNSNANLFPEVLSAEAEAGVTKYLCVFVHNAHGSSTLTDATVRLLSQLPGGADIAIGIDPTAASPVDDTDDQAVTIASITTAPAGVTFSAPTTEADALELGTLAAGECRAVWFRQKVAADAMAMAADNALYEVIGTTT